MSSDPLWKRLRNFNWEGAGISVKEAKKVQKASAGSRREKRSPSDESEPKFMELDEGECRRDANHSSVSAGD